MINEKNMINEHSDEYFIKGFGRYCCIDRILEAESWQDMEDGLKKDYSDSYQAIAKRLFDEFKFCNCVLKIEYAITDSLNTFLVKNELIKDWKSLEIRFLEKIKRGRKITELEAQEIVKEQMGGEIENILTPSMMLYCGGFGIGELIDFIRAYTKDFMRKEDLLDKMTAFNECRKIIVHNSLTSREDVGSKIESGISLAKEISALISEITASDKD